MSEQEQEQNTVESAPQQEDHGANGATPQNSSDNPAEGPASTSHTTSQSSAAPKAPIPPSGRHDTTLTPGSVQFKIKHYLISLRRKDFAAKYLLEGSVQKWWKMI